MINIILRMNNFNYDITHLVDTNGLTRTVEMKHTIDGEFNTASIYIPNVKADELGPTIDFSRGIIRNSLITITVGNKEYQWRVMADTVDDKLNNTYAHDIALIDRRSELTGINLPDMSLTQKTFMSVDKVRATLTTTTSDEIPLNTGTLAAGSTKLLHTVYNTIRGTLWGTSPRTIAGFPSIDEMDLPGEMKSVVANIGTGVGGLSEKSWSVKCSDNNTLNSSVISTTSTSFTLKNKNKRHFIKGYMDVYDGTPQHIGNEVEAMGLTMGMGQLFQTNSSMNNKYTKKELIFEAYSNGSLIYSSTHEVADNYFSKMFKYEGAGGVLVPLTPTIKYSMALIETRIDFNFDYTPSVDNAVITFKVRVKYVPWQTKVVYQYDPTNKINVFNVLSEETHTKDGVSCTSFGLDTAHRTLVRNRISASTLTSSYNSPSVANQTVYVYSVVPPTIYAYNNYELPTYIAVRAFSVSVETATLTVSETVKTLDQWIEKALYSTFLGETPRYTLENSTKARMMQVIAPEFTVKDYNLYQLISEVAEFLGGVNWEITKDNKIKFIFFDALETKELTEVDTQALTGSSDLNGYQSSLQINAENVALQTLMSEGPYSIRAEDDGNIQIKNDSIMIKTSFPINNIYKVEIKGIDYDLPGYTDEAPLNITQRVVEYEEWKTLPSQFSKSTSVALLYGRRYFTKSNTLYYKRGEPGIYGLGYCGGVAPGLWTTAVGNRAIFETGAVQIYTENAFNPTYNTTKTDSGAPIDDYFRLSIQYFPFTSSKAYIYKDDLNGFQVERSNYMNESSQVNDPALLGKITKSRVNRLGGTEYTKSGYVSDMSLLPILGSANAAGERLTQLITQSTDDYVKYFATYVNDYNKISTFVGKKSDYRLYEIPNKNIVNSTRIIRKQFALGPVDSVNKNKQMDIRFDKIFQNLEINPSNYYTGTNMVELNTEFDGNYLKTVYLPILYGNIGSTAFWKFKANDNYSVGEKQVSYSLGGTTIKVQQSVPYANKYGELDYMTAGFVDGVIVDPLIFPEDYSVSGIPVFVDYIDYLKDAREILSVEYQFSFHSTDLSKVRTFNGLAKFNAYLTNKKDYVVTCVPSYYIPNKEDIFVDLGKVGTNANSVIYSASPTGLTGTKRLVANVMYTRPTTTPGIIFYDNNTLELLLWVRYNGIVSPGSTYDVPVYIRMLDEPTLITVNIVTGKDDLVIPDQQFAKGITSTQVHDFLTPFLYRDDSNFNGLYLDSNFTTQLYGGMTLTSDQTIYMDWDDDTPTNSWVATGEGINDGEINPFFPYEVEPEDFDVYLDDANNYPKGFIMKVRPLIIDYENGEYNETLDEPVSYTKAQYYKVI